MEMGSGGLATSLSSCGRVQRNAGEKYCFASSGKSPDSNTPHVSPRHPTENASTTRGECYHPTASSQRASRACPGRTEHCEYLERTAAVGGNRGQRTSTSLPEYLALYSSLWNNGCMSIAMRWPPGSVTRSVHPCMLRQRETCNCAPLGIAVFSHPNRGREDRSSCEGR
eukprot:2591481-Rhodomonas_salina.2